jgi:hypothetical protein
MPIYGHDEVRKLAVTLSHRISGNGPTITSLQRTITKYVLRILAGRKKIRSYNQEQKSSAHPYTPCNKEENQAQAYLSISNTRK